MADEQKPNSIDDAALTALAERFCATPIPDSVCADLCATRQQEGRTGTNLMSVAEAKVFLAQVLADGMPMTSYANAPISLDARRADKARDSKLYSARDAMVEELRDIDAGVVEVDAMVLFTRIPDGNGLWTSGWRFAGLNTTEAVGFTALCLNMLMDRSRTGG